MREILSTHHQLILVIYQNLKYACTLYSYYSLIDSPTSSPLRDPCREN